MLRGLCGAVEAELDAAVLRRLATHVGLDVDTIYPTDGKAALRRRLEGFNKAAFLGPWVVLVDLDQEYACAPELLQDWLPQPAPAMCFRVAVRETESWLLADRERVASLLGVSPALVPLEPDSLPHPKEFLVQLARRSRKRSVREALVPTESSGRAVGPGYVRTLLEFVRDRDHGWRPAAAEAVSESLGRCLRALRALREREDP